MFTCNTCLWFVKFFFIEYPQYGFFFVDMYVKRNYNSILLTDVGVKAHWNMKYISKKLPYFRFLWSYFILYRYINVRNRLGYYMNVRNDKIPIRFHYEFQVPLCQWKKQRQNIEKMCGVIETSRTLIYSVLEIHANAMWCHARHQEEVILHDKCHQFSRWRH